MSRARAREVVVTPRAVGRFESYIRQAGDHWLWVGLRDRDGYGRFVVPTKDGGWWRNYRAHRFAYLAYVGEIPTGAHVLHTCDIPACVCPIHLYLGTPADNMRDKCDRGRWAGGRPRASGRGYLTDAEREAIVRAEGRHVDIAAQFDVNRSYVSNLKRKA